MVDVNKLIIILLCVFSLSLEAQNNRGCRCEGNKENTKDAQNHGRFSSSSSLGSNVSSPVFGDEAVVAEWTCGTGVFHDVLLAFDGSNWNRLMEEELESIVLSDPFDTSLPELSSITNSCLLEGDKVLVENYFNDEVEFEFDGSTWCRITPWRVQLVTKYDNATQTYYILNDANHKPIGIDPSGISSLGVDPFFTLQYPHISTPIRSFMVTPDETYASSQLFAGASVGISSASVFVSYIGGLSGRIFYTNAGGFQYNSSTSSNFWDANDYTFSWNNATGDLVVTHPQVTRNITEVSLENFNATNDNTVRVISNSQTQITLRFYDQNGNALLTPQGDINFLFHKGRNMRIPTGEHGNAQGNWWIMAEFEPDCK